METYVEYKCKDYESIHQRKDKSVFVVPNGLGEVQKVRLRSKFDFWVSGSCSFYREAYFFLTLYNLHECN